MAESGRNEQAIRGKDPFRLTGAHVLIIAMGFFGTVITVDVIMAILAVRTFSGVEAEKPYESGLAFNREIEAAKAQDARDWDVTQSVIHEDNGTVKVSARFHDRMHIAINGLDVTVHLKAPADAKRDHVASLNDRGAGLYEGLIEIKDGEWILELLAKDQTGLVYRSSNRISLK